MVDVLLDLWDPLPHDGEQVGGRDGRASQQTSAATAVWVEEGEVPAGAVAAEGRVHRRMSHGNTALVWSEAAT